MSKNDKSLLYRILNFGLEIRTITFLSASFFGFLYLFAYLKFGVGPISDFMTSVYGALIAILLIFLLFLSKKKVWFDIALILSFSMSIYVFPRILQYISSRPKDLKLFYILFPTHWDASQINSALLYMSLGIISVIMGFLVFDYLEKSGVLERYLYSQIRRISCRDGETKLSWFGIIFSSLIVYAIDCYYTIYIGLSAPSNCTADVPLKWLIHFFSGDIVVFYVIGLLLTVPKRLNWYHYFALFINVVAFLYYALLLGSRGGMLRVFMIVLSLAVAKYGNFKLKLSAIAIAAPIILALSVVSFTLGTQVREAHRYSCGSPIKSEKANDETGEGEEEELHSPVAEIKQPDLGPAGYEAAEKFVGKFEFMYMNLVRVKLRAKFAEILDRLGVMDYVVGLTTQPGLQSAKDKYFSWDYMRKNITNNLVPGTPYPDAQKMTNNMFPIVYRGFDFDHIVDNFLSEPFTIWGLSFVFFGKWFGLIFIFVTSTLLVIGYRVVSMIVPKEGTIYKAAYLWLVVTGAYFFNMGFDHMILIIAYGGLQIATFKILYEFGRKIENALFRSSKTRSNSSAA